mmetsp:Transcript_11689/g.33645  ORF Transcript_11689/g.33645 Transcript_11689/m.33645 type:complete len:328 (+) Transcript_11689:197-1180(+)
MRSRGWCFGRGTHFGRLFQPCRRLRHRRLELPVYLVSHLQCTAALGRRIGRDVVPCRTPRRLHNAASRPLPPRHEAHLGVHRRLHVGSYSRPQHSRAVASCFPRHCRRSDRHDLRIGLLLWGAFQSGGDTVGHGERSRKVLARGGLLVHLCAVVGGHRRRIHLRHARGRQDLPLGPGPRLQLGCRRSRGGALHLPSLLRVPLLLHHGDRPLPVLRARHRRMRRRGRLPRRAHIRRHCESGGGCRHLAVASHQRRRIAGSLALYRRASRRCLAGRADLHGHASYGILKVAHVRSDANGNVHFVLAPTWPPLHSREAICMSCWRPSCRR